ncbi:MAG: putative quinol monooxygenase [Brevinema sp.]
MDKPYFFCIQVEIDPKDRDEFFILVEFLSSKIRKTEGNIEFRLLEDLHNPNKFIVWEIWKSEKHVQEHQNSEYFQEYIPQIGKLYKKFHTLELTQIL